MTPENVSSILNPAVGGFVPDGSSYSQIAMRLKSSNGSIHAARLTFARQSDGRFAFQTLVVDIGNDVKLLAHARALATKRLGNPHMVQPDKQHPVAWAWKFRDWLFGVRRPGEILVDADAGNAGEE